MSGFLSFKNLNSIDVVGLNIEGCRPCDYLPEKCAWYNLIIAVDAPLQYITFNDVMEKVKKNKYQMIEEAIEEFNIDTYISELVNVINAIKADYKNILIHVHQYRGTTCLDRIIETKTGIRTILDETNFFTHPINYAKDFSEIDCLISLSQCASVNKYVGAGLFIVPTGFMNFDVKNNIIYTNVIEKPNNIRKYLEGVISYVEGKILVVNDLWNPTRDQIDNEGVLLLDDLDKKVLDFVIENTKIFDESHDYHHALKVAYNSTRILNNKFVLYLALLHDVCDHKYDCFRGEASKTSVEIISPIAKLNFNTESIKRETLSKYIHLELPEYAIIDGYIDEVSYSKQKNFDRVDPILASVRDGDRIEALGETGIFRCETFTRMRGGFVPKDVVIHCFEKLLRLVPEGYIATRMGKNLAIPLHNIIVDYVNKYIDEVPDCGFVKQRKIES